MTTLNERVHTGEFIITELPGTLSRDAATVTVATATRLAPGTVLGQLSASGKYVPYDNAGSDGSEEAAAILYAEVDNTDGVAPADFDGVVINYGAEVRKTDLAWAAGLVDADKTAAYADLAGKGIKARD